MLLKGFNLIPISSYTLGITVFVEKEKNLLTLPI